jgi:hypothetical protein
MPTPVLKAMPKAMPKATRKVLLAAAVWAVSFSGLAQTLPTQPTPQASPRPSYPANLFRIAGTIVNAVTGEPVHHATVAILTEADFHTVASVESDVQGHFSFDGLPAAKYQLTASKRGLRTGFFDEHEEFNSAVVTGPDQETADLKFSLTPGGIIRGTVLTDGGDPVENARVMLFVKTRADKPGPQVVAADNATTDDTGAYEFSSLPAGDYLLAVVAEPWYAMHRSSKQMAARAGAPDPAAVLDVVYGITYYGDTTDEAAAAHLPVAGGSRVQADFILHAVPAVKIQVETPRRHGGSIARAELRQMVFGTEVGAESAGFMDAMQTGVTEFAGVAPGHYELTQGDPPRTVSLDATASQQVDPSLGSLSSSVRGQLSNQAGAPLTDEATVLLEPAEGAPRRDPISGVCLHGAFTFPTVPPGEYQLTAQSAGLYLPIAAIATATGATGGPARRGNLVSVGDRPVTLAVTVMEGATRVEGFARRDGKGVAGVMVELVPDDLRLLAGLARRDQSDTDGSFALRDVVPGKYTLVAIEDGWGLDWEQPQVIARYLPGGLPVTVGEGSRKLTSLNAAVPVQPR